MNTPDFLKSLSGLKIEARSVFRSAFARNVFLLMSGSAVSQILNFAISPILSRLYDPAAFGVLGVYLSVVSIFSSITTLGYDQAMILPANEEDSINLFGLSAVAIFLITTISAGLCWIAGKQITSLMGSPELSRFIWIIPISVFLAGLYQLLNSWSTRHKQFKRVSISIMVRAVTLSLVQILLGLARIGPIGLVAGNVAGDATFSLAMGVGIAKEDLNHFKSALRIKQMKRLAREYSDFPIYNGTQNLLNSISQNIPTLLLASFFGPAVVGFYSLGIRLLQAPSNFILSALRQVLFQKLTEVHNQNSNLYRLFRKVTFALLAIVIIPAVIVMIFAPQIFGLFLGDSWTTAGEYARWLILWIAAGFCNLPSVLFAQILRKQKQYFWFGVALLISRIGALFLGVLSGEAILSIIAYSLVGFIFNTYLIFWMNQTMRSLSSEVA